MERIVIELPDEMKIKLKMYLAKKGQTQKDYVIGLLIREGKKWEKVS